MTAYRVRHSEVRSVMEQMRAETNLIQAELERLEGIARNSIQYWTGQSQLAYHDAQREWSAGAETMRAQLQNMSVRLGAIDQNYLESDTRSAAGFAGR